MLPHLLGNLLGKPLLGELEGVTLSGPEDERSKQSEGRAEQTLALFWFGGLECLDRDCLGDLARDDLDRGGSVLPGDDQIADENGRAHRSPRVIADETPPVGRRFSPFDDTLDVLVEVSADLRHPSANLFEFRGCGCHDRVSSSNPVGSLNPENRRLPPFVGSAITQP
jgi:hypothetical protein